MLLDACVPMTIALLCLAAAEIDFLQEYERMMVHQVVALVFHTHAPELHLQHVARLTALTSLTLRESNVGESDVSSLILLHRLAHLNTLDLSGFRRICADFQQLQSLRKLVLKACGTSSCDLTSCTQITSLAILCVPQRIQLPSGSRVQLQHLSISALRS